MNTSINRIELIKTALSVLHPTHLSLEDKSAAHAGHPGAKSGGGHYNLVIESKEFEGKSAIQRHQMIYSALGELMKTDIHAISISAKTPTEK